VRVVDRDRAQPAERPDSAGEVGVEQRGAPPEDVAAPPGDEQRALADAELGGDADPDEAMVVAELVPVRPAQLLEGRPALAAPADVLALVLADRAPLGRAGVVGRAGETDPGQGVRR